MEGWCPGRTRTQQTLGFAGEGERAGQQVVSACIQGLYQQALRVGTQGTEVTEETWSGMGKTGPHTQQVRVSGLTFGWKAETVRRC